MTCRVLLALLQFVCGAMPMVGFPPSQDEDQQKKFERKGGHFEKANIVSGPDGELTSPDIGEGRDLTLYDQGGHLNCFTHTFADSVPKTRKEQAQLEARARKHVARAREFIFVHWQEHRRGYIRLSFDSVDAHSTSHVFIEPDTSGTWQVMWRIAHDFSHITTRPVLRKVEEDFSQNERGELVFKDIDGDEWGRL